MFTRIWQHNRRAARQRVRLIGTLVAVIAVIGLVADLSPPVSPAAAQEGGDIQVNVPAIVNLNPGETLTRTFAVQPGNSVEIILSRLTTYTFSAVLIDPSQNPTPLTPGADGNITTQVLNAPVGGLYALVLQASEGSGGLLIQVNAIEGGSNALPVGESSFTVGGEELSIDLVPPVGLGDTVLVLSADPNAPGATIPGFTLIDPVTGEIVLMISGGLLPSIAISLPAQQTFTLVVEPSDPPQPLNVSWDEGSATSTGETTDSADDTGGPTATPTVEATVVITCEMAFSGQVNIRSGPGLEYDPPVAQAQPGDVVPVTGHDGTLEWYQIVYNGNLGWAAGNIANTSLQGDCANLPVVTALPPGVPSATPTITSTPTAGPSPTATATVSGPSPTATVQGAAQSTATFTPSFTPTTQQQQQQSTATFTPSYTPTTQQQQPTATFTPSYTPTTPPAAQVAPEDARFNNPLNLQLDTTGSVTDFVSYPGGDNEDRVRWDIIGMNSNASLSGGRARLTLAVSCFGTGLENVQFFTGGQTYSCGQTIVDQEVTFNSKTGSVVITAVGGEGTYVQWVLTGTAVRVN